MKKLILTPMRRIFGKLLGLKTLHDRIDQLEYQVADARSLLAILDKDSMYWEISRSRWRKALPNEGLTWGKKLSGNVFVEKVISFAPFESTKTILEIGPGYGRLLKSVLEMNVPFENYCGLDISEENVQYLSRTYGSENVRFIHADAEKCDLELTYDVFLSSLTMKHLFPTFERALTNLVRFANPGSMFFFDLIEGDRKLFEEDRVTYIKWYSKDQVHKILNSILLELVSFDEVYHDPDHPRLLVIARKSKG